MGTTIRRQPITTPIPASPDYKFLNITNFGGIEKSSNPFVVSSNTASDCLNVYVDEDNALSTRPRLSPKYNFLDILKTTNNTDKENVEKISIHSLSDGYLVTVFSKNGSVDRYKFPETKDGLSTPYRMYGTIARDEGMFLEHHDGLYHLSEKNYLKAVEKDGYYEWEDVEGYIPTTKIGKTIVNGNETSGDGYESLNLLTSKYKESYFWDGTWNTEDVIKFSDEVIENNYVNHEDSDIKDSDNRTVSGEIIQPLKQLNNNLDGKKYYLAYLEDLEAKFGSKFVILCVDKFGKIIDSESKGVLFYKQPEYDVSIHDRMVCSDNGLTVAYVDNYETDSNHRYMYVATRPSINSEFNVKYYGYAHLGTGDNIFPNKYTKKFLKITSDGKVISHYSKNNKINVEYMPDLSVRKSQAIPFVNNAGDYDISVNPDFGYTAICSKYADDTLSHVTSMSYYTSLFNEDKSEFSWTGSDVHLWDTDSEDSCVDATITLSNDGYEAIISLKFERDGVFSRSSVWNLAKKIDSDTGVTQKVFPGERKLIKESVSSDEYSNLLINYGIDDDVVYYQNLQTKTIGVLDPLKSILLTKKLSIDIDLTTAYCTKNYILGKPSQMKHYLRCSKYSFLFESADPLLVVTRDMRNADRTTYNKWLELHRQFLKSRLTTRFNNETWFASGNTTYHTLYNDLTYVPMTSYNELGEDFDVVTGLCIINDNILAAYKRNKIYTITPITIGNELTYAYTETKNVIGNHAVNAPILTILTEMPTIVAYDGIFALNQLENVQSSDRITTLISEAINPLWLKESKSDIEGCLTLNRLYWTYYILPHEKAGDNTYTKVYLLDNRTQQWYYWELPLLVTNAFVKNDKTHLVNSSGRVFTLETSDLVNEYNTDVTEYYDNVGNTKQIIPWHWYSQILSLNTINYSKRLVDTTFILTDTDTQDEYALDYSFKAWRKSVSETNATTINSNIHYVQSTTKRTMIPRFNFIQFRINNTEDDLDNNKLRLVGLGLKYVLLEGLY